jgi:hypothetical protein
VGRIKGGQHKRIWRRRWRVRNFSRCVCRIHRMIFVPGLLLIRYKCVHICTGWWLRLINVKPTHLYRSEPTPGTNVRHLYQVGRRRSQRSPQGTFVPGGGSIQYKYSHLHLAQKYSVQMKDLLRDKCPIL